MAFKRSWVRLPPSPNQYERPRASRPVLILRRFVMFNIVLLEPEIPSNTGNIGRTCLVTGSCLHLIMPFGFILNDKNLKRAGMDYWNELDSITYIDWNDFLEKNKAVLKAPFGCGSSSLYLATTKARRAHSDVSYKDGDFIMFGKESAGIPEEILMQSEQTCVRIPMKESMRSLNLANSAAVVLYEALRQSSYEGLKRRGELHNHKWTQ